MLLRCFLVCKTNQLYSVISSLLLWCSEISKTLQHSSANVAQRFAWFRGSLCVYLVTLTHSNFIRLPVKLMPREDRLLLHIEYWAFHCTDSFSMDWITIKFIGCGVTVFAVQICHFWSNSDFSKTPITPQVSCHVLVMSWEHNDSIFDASLVAKWLHIWNVCSAICITKMSVSWRVLVRFWLFKNPYESSCVLPCPGHVLDKSWVCPGHVQAMSVAPSNSLLMNFFQFFSIFFFFEKNFFLWKVGYTLPC